jgi:hypothetical protein
MIRIVWIALTAALLAGCAGDPRYATGVQWVVDGGTERERLERMGFPQYSEGG